jgi:hypothetical protein
MKTWPALFDLRFRNGSYRSVIRLMFVTMIQTNFILPVVAAWAQSSSSVPDRESQGESTRAKPAGTDRNKPMETKSPPSYDPRGSQADEHASAIPPEGALTRSNIPDNGKRTVSPSR